MSEHPDKPIEFITYIRNPQNGSLHCPYCDFKQKEWREHFWKIKFNQNKIVICCRECAQGIIDQSEEKEAIEENNCCIDNI